jgi:hypothetical protein
VTSPQVVQSTAPIGAAAICVGHACDRTRSSGCGALGRAAQPAPLPVLATLRRPARLPGAAADAEPQKGLSRASSGSKPRWRRRARGVPASSAAVQPPVARTPPQLRRRPLEASPTPGPQLPASAGPPTFAQAKLVRISPVPGGGQSRRSPWPAGGIGERGQVVQAEKGKGFRVRQHRGQEGGVLVEPGAGSRRICNIRPSAASLSCVGRVWRGPEYPHLRWP